MDADRATVMLFLAVSLGAVLGGAVTLLPPGADP